MLTGDIRVGDSCQTGLTGFLLKAGQRIRHQGWGMRNSIRYQGWSDIKGRGLLCKLTLAGFLLKLVSASQRWGLIRKRAQGRLSPVRAQKGESASEFFLQKEVFKLKTEN